VTWIGFNSTTTDKKQTLQHFGNGGTLFRLVIRSGRDISLLSLFSGESELILMPNSVFTVKIALSSQEVSCGVLTRVPVGQRLYPHRASPLGRQIAALKDFGSANEFGLPDGVDLIVLEQVPTPAASARPRPPAAAPHFNPPRIPLVKRFSLHAGGFCTAV
jgi:hypothetical protein